MHTDSVGVSTCTGSILEHGAQVMTWAPHGRAPVLFTSQAGEAASNTAIRGGIPVCFPWFGPGREPGAPFNHGFARTTTWRRIGATGDEIRTIAYRLDREVATDDYWPYAYEAVLTASFGSRLTVALQVTNQDERAFSFEAALHTYLAIEDVAQVRVEGLDGVSYVDKTADGAVRRQAGPVTFSGETDRVYASAGPVSVVDPVGGRQIVVSTSGASGIVVWNPGQEKGSHFADLGPGDWQRFVCVEAGCVLDGAVHLEPGRTHTLSTTVSI